jgi:hypothetical protein
VVLNRSGERHEKGRYTEEQIAHALGQAKARMKAEDICRKLGINEQTFYPCSG